VNARWESFAPPENVVLHLVLPAGSAPDNLPALFGPLDELPELTLAHAAAGSDLGGGPLLLLYRPAGAALAAAMAAGVAPAEAIAAWRDGAEQVLRLARRHRRTALIADLDAARAAPAAFRDALGRLLGQDLPDLPAVPPSLPEPLFAVLAGALLQIPDLKELQAELEAASLPLGPETRALGEVEAVLAERQGLIAETATKLESRERDLRALRSDNAAARQEIQTLQTAQDELRKRIEDQQLEIETHFLASKTLEQRLETEREKARSAEKASVPRAEWDAGERRRAALAATAETVTAERDDANRRALELEAERDGLREERDRLRDELVGLRAEVDKLLGSKSWRLTEPLRRVRRLFRRTV
jgi:hypothetical protein